MAPHPSRPDPLPSTIHLSLQPTSPPHLPSSIFEDPSSHTFLAANTAEKLTYFRFKWGSFFDEDSNWATLPSNVRSLPHDGALTLLKQQRRPRPAARRTDRPSGKPTVDYRRPTIKDPRAARRLQSLNKHSKKRAVQEVLNNDSPLYDGSLDDVLTYFTDTLGPKECDPVTLEEASAQSVPSTVADSLLFTLPSAEEIHLKPRSLANPAPCKDRLEYRRLRLLDPKCQIQTKSSLGVLLLKTSRCDRKLPQPSSSTNLAPLSILLTSA